MPKKPHRWHLTVVEYRDSPTTTLYHLPSQISMRKLAKELGVKPYLDRVDGIDHYYTAFKPTRDNADA